MKPTFGKRCLLSKIAGAIPALALAAFSLAGCAGSEPVKTPAAGESQPLITLSENMPTADMTNLKTPPRVAAGLRRAFSQARIRHSPPG